MPRRVLKRCSPCFLYKGYKNLIKESNNFHLFGCKSLLISIYQFKEKSRQTCLEKQRKTSCTGGFFLTLLRAIHEQRNMECRSLEATFCAFSNYHHSIQDCRIQYLNYRAYTLLYLPEKFR